MTTNNFRTFTIDFVRGRIVVTRDDGRVLGRFSSETQALQACHARAVMDKASTKAVAGKYPKDVRPKGDIIAVFEIVT